jgi:hypothetical protein
MFSGEQFKFGEEFLIYDATMEKLFIGIQIGKSND